MTFSLEDAINHFFNEKVDEAIQIQITERKSNGRGVFFVHFKSEINVDCYYIPFHDKKFPQQYLQYFVERLEDPNLNSVLFFIFSNKDEHKILELDLDTNNVNRSKNDTQIEEVESGSH